MVSSLRSVRYAAVVACAPWVVMAEFECSVNYNTKTGNPTCDSITEAGCSDSSCCTPVDNCTAYTCASPTTKKTAVPAGTCTKDGTATDCQVKCCEQLQTNCATWHTTETCSTTDEHYDTKKAATAATTAAEYQTKCCAVPTTCEAWRVNAGKWCDENHYEDKSKYAVTATKAEYASKCCTAWSTCGQFSEYKALWPPATEDQIYDPSKASVAANYTEFDPKCTSTKATCSAIACTSNLYELMNPVPTSKCDALTCTQSECCKTKVTSCLSKTCKSSLARDDAATYSGTDAEHEAACCKAKFSCSAAGQTTTAADINEAFGGSSSGSGVLAAAIAFAAIGFMSK